MPGKRSLNSPSGFLSGQAGPPDPAVFQSSTSEPSQVLLKLRYISESLGALKNTDTRIQPQDSYVRITGGAQSNGTGMKTPPADPSVWPELPSQGMRATWELKKTRNKIACRAAPSGIARGWTQPPILGKYFKVESEVRPWLRMPLRGSTEELLWGEDWGNSTFFTLKCYTYIKYLYKTPK